MTVAPQDAVRIGAVCESCPYVRTIDWTLRDMNSTPFFDAIKRHKKLAFFGIVVAMLLGAATFVTSKPVYQANSVVFVTQQGFPAGRIQPSAPGTTGSPYVDPASLVSLAALYSRLAESDVVRSEVLATGPLKGEVTIEVLNSGTSEFGSGGLPLVQVAGLANTKSDAIDLATRWTEAFMSYIERQQQAAGVPAAQRVILEQVTVPTPEETKAVEPRSVARPVAIIFAVVILFLGIILALDKQRSRRRAASEDVASAADAESDATPEKPDTPQSADGPRAGRSSNGTEARARFADGSSGSADGDDAGARKREAVEAASVEGEEGETTEGLDTVSDSVDDLGRRAS